MKNIFCLVLALSISSFAMCCNTPVKGCDPGTKARQVPDTSNLKKNQPKTTPAPQPGNRPKPTIKKENPAGEDDDVVTPLSWRPGGLVY